MLLYWSPTLSKYCVLSSLMYPAGIEKFSAVKIPASVSFVNIWSRFAFLSASFLELWKDFFALSNSFSLFSKVDFADAICALAEPNAAAAVILPVSTFSYWLSALLIDFVTCFTTACAAAISVFKFASSVSICGIRVSTISYRDFRLFFVIDLAILLCPCVLSMFL